jgi:hypothetical protein
VPYILESIEIVRLFSKGSAGVPGTDFRFARSLRDSASIPLRGRKSPGGAWLPVGRRSEAPSAAPCYCVRPVAFTGIFVYTH